MGSKVFEHILQNDEEIVWSNGVNKKAYILKSILKGILIGIFVSVFLGSIMSMPLISLNNNSSIKDFFQTRLLIGLILFAIVMIIAFINAYLNAKNTFFAVTNKRVIVRYGSFNNVFTHYSLKNVGNVQVSGSVFDDKGSDASANLIISVKDFHTNTDGNKAPKNLTIISLKGAYEAYKIITEKTDGNNEVFRIKTEN